MHHARSLVYLFSLYKTLPSRVNPAANNLSYYYDDSFEHKPYLILGEKRVEKVSILLLLYIYPKKDTRRFTDMIQLNCHIKFS